jgi:hypothetical protein
LKAASSVTAGENVLDSMASPAIAIFGSFVSVSFWVQEKAEKSRRKERIVFKRVGE